MIFTCKQASTVLAEKDYATLPWHQKLSLRFHVATCLVCGRYNRQVMLIQDTVRNFRKRKEVEMEQGGPEAPCLTADCKERLQAALREATADKNSTTP